MNRLDFFYKSGIDALNGIYDFSVYIVVDNRYVYYTSNYDDFSSIERDFVIEKNNIYKYFDVHNWKQFDVDEFEFNDNFYENVKMLER